MNQIKIGAFISDCRKAKGWTQNQLGKNWELQIKPYQNRKQVGLCQTYLCLCLYAIFWILHEMNY